MRLGSRFASALRFWDVADEVEQLAEGVETRVRRGNRGRHIACSVLTQGVVELGDDGFVGDGGVAQGHAVVAVAE